MKKLNYLELGRECQIFRKYVLKQTQTDICTELNCTKQMVSKFEKGRSQSITIYQWYLDRGFTYNNRKGEN